MTTPTHVFTGAVIAKFSIDMGLVPFWPELVYPISMLAANLPDLDVLFIKFPKNHRVSFLHTPVFWCMMFAILLLFSSIIKAPLFTPFIALVGINILMHLILDTFDMSTGIAWLSPWNKTFFSVLPRIDARPETIQTYMRAYMKHPIIVAEGVVVVSGIIAFWRF